MAGNYQLAADLYRKAIIEQPELAHTYIISLNIIRKKLGLEPFHTSTLLTQISDSALGENLTTAHLDADLQENAKLDVAYREVAHFKSSWEVIEPLNQPLVSVLMATQNCSEKVEQSITSLLRQTWKNIEIIVVDLASRDSTWTILKRLAQTVTNLKCYQLNTPQGLPFGLNHAFNMASGDYIFFQNSSDFSHPNRINLCMSELTLPGIAAINVSSLSLGSKLTSTMSMEKYCTRELMPVGLLRSTFIQTGSLSHTALSDEEFLDRLSVWSQSNNLKIVNLDLPLYYRTYFSDKAEECSQVINSLDNAIFSTYRNTFKQIHRNINPQQFQSLFHFPVIRDVIDTPSEISHALSPPSAIVANICSIPERATLLKQTLASLARQVDHINIYLDRYHEVPDFIKDCHPSIDIYTSATHPGHRDNGKFLAYSNDLKDCYYFTVDDDIVYPPDYTESMIRSIESYSRQVVVGLHGVLLPEKPKGYFSSYRKVYSFNRELELDTLVNILGTGTVAFHSSLLREVDITQFTKSGMADIYLSVFCKQRNIPMIALSRPDEWLKELPSPNTSLYHEYKESDDGQSELIRANYPWGYTAIKYAANNLSSTPQNSAITERLNKMIPIMWECLK